MPTCTGLTMLSPITTEMGPQSATDRATFLAKAYTGEPVKRHWGTLAISISGISAKQLMPVLKNHDPEQIVGYSTASWSDNNFWVSGQFSGVTAAGKEAQALAAEGFPWQASIGVVPVKVEEIRKGETLTVNGREVAGPAEVWLSSEIIEVSFVPNGADGNTSVSLLTRFIEPTGEQAAKTTHTEKKGEGKMAITLTQLETDAPELLAQIREEARAAGVSAGAEAERARIQGIEALKIPGHEALVERLKADGKTTGEQAAVAILMAEKEIRAQAAKSFSADSPPPIPHLSLSAVDDAKDTVLLPLSERIDAEWKKDAKLRVEFGEDFDAYAAYCRAADKGQIKLLKSRKDK